jgi:ADP-heptose:LPS heptosyltransferase
MSAIEILSRAMGGVRRRVPADPDAPRILVIRRNRMGDMICTLPLLRALRRRFPRSRLTVACDQAGFPIAQACPAVDRVILLRRGWRLWVAPFGSPRRWQDFDCVIAVKAGFDRRLGCLARLTNAARRIGYENGAVSEFYTDTVPIPGDAWNVHQVEATLGLLAPLGITLSPVPVDDLKLDLPEAALAFAEKLSPFWAGGRFVLINLSSTTPLPLSDEDFAALIAGMTENNDIRVGLVALAADLPRARKLAGNGDDRVRVLATPGPLELAALMSRAQVVVTGEGGGAHLAAAMGVPAVVLWSEGPFEKWYSRGPNHTFVRLEPGEKRLPLDRVRAVLAAHL